MTDVETVGLGQGSEIVDRKDLLVNLQGRSKLRRRLLPPRLQKLLHTNTLRPPSNTLSAESYRDRNSKEATSSIQLEGMCMLCRDIDFAQIASRLRSGDPWTAVVSIDLGDRVAKAAQTKSMCPLCLFFKDVRLEPPLEEILPWRSFRPKQVEAACFKLVGLMFELGGYHHPCFLVVPRGYRIPLHQFGQRRISHSESSHFESHVKDNKLVAIVDHKLDQSTVRSGDEAPRHLDLRIAPQVDFTMISSWFNSCLMNHEKCRATKSVETRPHDPIVVIDCLEKNLVPTPLGCIYAALSYVWGQEQSILDTSLSMAPQVIKDAMTVTQKLGLQYLWVDRLCIPADPDQRHQEIQRMDLIYSGAEITIVDATGSDANYGLQGVTRERSGQRRATSRDATRIVSCLQDPVDLIRNSPWSRRAWTLQEGILSRRCIIFTKQQAYFECLEGRRAEIVHAIDLAFYFPIRLDHLRQASAFSREINVSHYHSDNVLHKLLIHIHDYTARALSYDSDSLNAILGVLNAAAMDQFSHHYGIPVHQKDNGDDFVKVLSLWYHTGNNALIRRRKNFPSWSYVGFAGKADFFRPTSLHSYNSEAQDIGFETYNGSRIPFLGLFSRSIANRSLYALVKFKARAIRPHEESRKEIFREAHWSVPTHAGQNILNYSEPGFADLLCVHVMTERDFGKNKYWLLVRSCGEFSERIGVFESTMTIEGDIFEEHTIILR